MRVAVLSAEGKLKDSPLPFFEGMPPGPLFHQIVKLPEALPIGEPVILPLTPDDVAVSACWSPDGRYVVYHDILFFQLVIVPAEKGDLP